MGIQNWSEDVIVVDLPVEPQLNEELRAVTEIVRDRGNCDIVVDFSQVDILTSSSISALLKLQKLLTDCQCRMILCSIAPATKSIFKVTGIEEIFEFVDNKFFALTSLQMVAKK
jgi:anti-anti-sigma factor